MRPNLKIFLTSVAISLGTGGLSALLTRKNMNLSDLTTPPLSPPAFLFPVVWTVLYVLMGIAAALIFLRRQEDPDAASSGLWQYGMSLFVNFFWSIFFFNQRAFLFSFFWLILLFVLILRYTLQYKKLSSLAAALQIPYLVWVLFAGYLNLAIALLNT